MKAVFVAFLVLSVSAFALLDSDPIPDFTEEINNGQSSWVAGKNFENLTWGQAKRMCGTRTTVARVAHRRPIFKAVPDAFDWRQQTPMCVHHILDQGQCGSCWAFGATEALSDRFCIATKGQTNVVLSAQYLVSCDTTDYGCGGGYLENAWAFLESSGVPTWDCVKYASAGGEAPDCPTTCDDGSKLKFYKAGSPVAMTSETAMMAEIYANGPVEAAFDVYQDFFNYKSGIYSHKSGGLAGGHAIKVIGWGVQSGKKYWICANSWDTTWGLQGYFWILKGSDECGIESNAYAAKPQA